MIWINFLHLYQPPTTEKELIEKIAAESYNFILDALEAHLNVKMTINICGGLSEQLERCGCSNILERLRRLAERKQVELTSSAAFHPLLALLPKEEVIYQIETNDAINKRYFGNAYSPQGFFIPEMAYNKKLAHIISRLGYKWIILDDIHLGGKLGNVNYEKGYTIKGTGLKVLFRKRGISKTYVPEAILDLFSRDKIPDKIITATDGELYGHHHSDINGAFYKLLENTNVQTVTISDFFSRLDEWEEVDPVPASWETTENEIKLKEPYILWNNSRNKIQKKIWKLANLALRLANKHKTDAQYGWSRHHLNKGLASCTFWWAAARDFSESFGPISWNPDEIEKGTDELIRSIRSLERVSRLSKIKAERLYINIKKMIWEKHWKYYWKK